MPRWHHSDSSSERYQEVKSIKTFYAAHISRSQAKSMFGNWTTCGLDIILGLFFCHFFSQFELSHFFGHFSEWIEGTLCAQLLLQFNTDTFRTLQTL